MKFGVREICNVVFKAKSNRTIGKTSFVKGQPVLYIDTATTSSMEGATTAVYAQGGRGNTRLITWEGEKTLTFTVEDALLSPIGFAILSGAGIFNGVDSEGREKTQVHAHVTESGTTDATGKITLKYEADTTAPIFVVEMEEDGSVTGNMLQATVSGKELTLADAASKNVFVDYYAIKEATNVTELQISGDVLAGDYYVEADTLFREQKSGKDMPAIITIPKAHVQSGFTFNMASTGDPSTFSFVMDAMPDYTMFDTSKKVLCVIQIVDEKDADNNDYLTVMGHETTEADYSSEDSVNA